MSKRMFMLLAACIMFAGTISGNLSVGHASKAPTIVQELKSLGRIGPKAIEVSIRTGKPKGAFFAKGESIRFHLKASQKAYVAAIYVSRDGDVIVLYPNRESPGGAVPAKKEYTLFGPDSEIELKVNPRIREAHIFFYVFSKAIDLSPLKIAEGNACIRIPHSSPRDLKVLMNRLKRMARDEGFNRWMVAVTPDGKSGASVRLMGLPLGIRSEEPTPVTGAQGFKGKSDKPVKY